MPGPAASLTSALAVRLAAVVPPRVSVTANGHSLSVSVDAGPPVTIGIKEIVDQPGEVLGNVRNAAYAALAGTQDHLVELTSQRWPVPLSGAHGLPLPEVVVDAAQIMLRYGDAAEPALVLEPISLDELRPVGS